MYGALSLEFMNLLQNFHLAVIEYLYSGRRAVFLHTFTTRHRPSNRKLSIVMALSTTFTQCPRKLPNSVDNNKIRAFSPFKVIQGHRFWYQSKAHIRLPISDCYWLISCLAPFARYIAFGMSKIAIFDYPYCV